MLSNRDRRNGLVFTGANSKPTYGKYNNKRRAQYNLSDIVLDINDDKKKTNCFDISNDSFELSDDEFIGNDDDSLNQDIDIPYAKSSIINISVSDDENDYLMGSPDKRNSTSPKSPPSNKVLQELSPVLARNSSNILANDINEKRIPLNSSNVPSMQKNNSGLSHLRSSMISNNSKRWSLLSFNSEDKENITSVKSKRFSIASTQSSSSKEKSKRFSISSQQSVQSSSSSFKHVLNKVSYVLSSVSVGSNENSAESTPYKNIKPGVVGENKNKRSSESANLTPLSMRTYNHIKPPQSSQSTTTTTVTSTLRHAAKGSKADESDNVSMLSSASSLRSSRSKFRLSSLFTSSKRDTNDNDNVSIRSSVRGRNSLSDMRKSVLSLSSSKHSIFRLSRKDSISEIQLDKTMISLPRPDNDSRYKLNNKLRNSSSVLSINSVTSRQPTITTMNTVVSSKSQTTIATALPTEEYEDAQLNKLVHLTKNDHILPFREFIDNLKLKEDEILIKFAEASFSEVYVLKDMKTNQNKRIFKIIPFGDEANGQPTIDNIFQELKINLNLSDKEGFIHLNDCFVVKGVYPNYLLKLWDDYNEMKESNNYRPEFEETQKFLVLDLEYGGVDLEKFKITSWNQSLKIFWDTVQVLSKVEQSLKFEHRDLHWGNIVIDYKNNHEDDSTIEVKIIDYTLSRMCDDNDEVIFTRLDHQDFFKGRGDYQFDIYRFMRNEIKSLQKDQTKDIDWSLSSFKNNLYWLHYLLDKLVNAKKLPTGQDSAEFKTLQYLYKSLDPRRKKLNEKQTPHYKTKEGSRKKRQAVYFQDFDNCQDLLEFGEYYNLI